MGTHLVPFRELGSVEEGRQSPRPYHDSGVFPTPAIHAALMALYDAKLVQWPVPFEELDVPTSHGTTHVVVSGPEDGESVILIHMAACTSFIWAPIIAPFASRYRTYAVDIIGDVNKSVLADRGHRPRNGPELGGWMCEVADALNVPTSHVIAGSYGGWVAMHYAARAPGRVRRLALIVPMGLPGWTQTGRVLIRLATIQLGLSGAKLERTLSYLMGDDPAARRLAGDWFSLFFESKCKMNAAQPLPIPLAMFHALPMPTLIVLGDRDPLIGNVQRAANRARTHIRNAEVEIIANGTHAVHIEASHRVSTRVLEFLDQGGRT